MLTKEQIMQFNEFGFVSLPGLFDANEIAVLSAETHRVFELQRPEIIRTDDGQPRVAMAMHWYSDIFKSLLHHPKLLTPANQLLGEPFYCHQFKVVTKAPFGKVPLPWHQDYGTWHETDGLPEPKAITIGIFLEEVTEFNGALAFIPGSHLDKPMETQSEFFPGKAIKSITLGPKVLTPLIEKHGINAPKGKAGTVVIFDSRVVHGSGTNQTPWWRHIVYMSPNPLSNRGAKAGRDEMFALREFEALEPNNGLLIK